MTKKEIKSVRTIGIIMIILSSISLFSIVILNATLFLIAQNDKEARLVFQKEPLFKNFGLISFIILLTTIIFLISSIKLNKYKNWARKLIIFNSLFSIVLIWCLMIFVNMTIPNKEGLFSLYSVTISLLFSIPMLILIWFLNRKKIKIHFA